MGELGDKQEKFTLCIGKLIVWAFEHGYRLRFGDTYPGKSKHSLYGRHPLGLAVDLHLFIDGVYQKTTEAHKPLGEYYESLDPKATWGGRWDDGNHYSWDETKR